MAKWYRWFIDPNGPTFQKLKYFYWMRVADYPRRLRNQVHERIESGASLNIIIGGGNIPYAGWIHTDYPMFDATYAPHWEAYFGEYRIDRLLAEHVLEHLTPEQNQRVFSNAFRFLKPGGHFRVAVPDGYHPDQEYQAFCRPGGHGPGADDHKVFWNHETFSALVEACGLDVRLLEYHTRDGQLYTAEWSDSDGPVRRTVQKNYRGPWGGSYTSLIFDAVKPVK